MVLKFKPLIIAFFISSFLGSSQSHAEYFIDGKVLHLDTFEKDRLLISKKCAKKCKAYKAWQSAAKIKKIETYGGQNPGSVICKSVGGVSVLAIDQDKNQNSFCKFNDDSVVDNGSLSAKYYSGHN